MLSPEEIAVSVTATAIAMSKNLQDDDMLLIAAVFMQLADTLITISTARDKIEKKRTAKQAQNDASVQ